MGCGHYCPLIGFGICFIIAGFIVTMVGNFAKSFWTNDDDWCEFCKSERETTQTNLANCQIAGPIVLVIGITMTVVGCVIKKRAGASTGMAGSGNTATYSSTGAAGTSALNLVKPPPGTVCPPPTSANQYPTTTPTTYPGQYGAPAPYPGQYGAPAPAAYPAAAPPAAYPAPPAAYPAAYPAPPAAYPAPPAAYPPPGSNQPNPTTYGQSAPYPPTMSGQYPPEKGGIPPGGIPPPAYDASMANPSAPPMDVPPKW